LKAFQEFDLTGCGGLQKLSKSTSQLKALQEFDLKGCRSLQNLLTSIA
jgi:hypothetical protein